MDIFTNIPNDCKIEKIGEPYKISSIIMQDVEYSAPNKQSFLKLEKKLEQVKNIYSFMQKSNEFGKIITARFIIEDPNRSIS